MTQIKNKKKIFVGVSGGVDSAVSLALLKEQGHDVTGVFIRTWTPDFIECTWQDERRDAMRVCAYLNVPFLECDAEQAYKKGVADYMIEEYRKGNVPNPDVMCNREVKFGVFWDFARERGADAIATGHYAQVCFPPLIRGGAKGGGVFRFQNPPQPSLVREGAILRKSPDISKDQSYFLWTLTQADLAHTFFPVGHMQKSEVRKLAEKYKLPTATKKDSQGVCFLGPLDMKDFLKHYIESRKGDVINENGKIIGYHDGAEFFALGERHGFTITEKTPSDKPYYVVAKDIQKNTIVVTPLLVPEGARGGDFKGAPPRPTCTPPYKGGEYIKIKNTNWISNIPEENKNYTAQIRYHGENLNCKISCRRPTSVETEIIFDEPTLVSSGQSIVIYDGDICMGGGVVI